MDRHQHADAIDRIKGRILQDHFNVSRQAIHQWKRNGIPERLLNSVRLLAMMRGVPVPELTEEKP